MTTILRLPCVIQRTGLSRSSIYSYVSQKRFPAPIRLGARSVGWLETDINDWIASRIKEARAL